MWWNLLLREEHTPCHGDRLRETIAPKESTRTHSGVVELELPSSPALLQKVDGSFLPPARRGLEGEGDVGFSCCSRRLRRVIQASPYRSTRRPRGCASTREFDLLHPEDNRLGKSATGTPLAEFAVANRRQHRIADRSVTNAAAHAGSFLRAEHIAQRCLRDGRVLIRPMRLLVPCARCAGSR